MQRRPPDLACARGRYHAKSHAQLGEARTCAIAKRRALTTSKTHPWHHTFTHASHRLKDACARRHSMASWLTRNQCELGESIVCIHMQHASLLHMWDHVLQRVMGIILQDTRIMCVCWRAQECHGHVANHVCLLARSRMPWRRRAELPETTWRPCRSRRRKFKIAQQNTSG